MKKKMRKFADGGFSSAQEEWLGGADRTDPYILARMRAAVPDEKMKKSVLEETSADLDPYGAANRETSADLDPYGAANKKPASVEKTVVKTKVTPKVEPKADAPYSKPAGNYVNPEKGLERVEPENYITGAGLLKGMLKQVVNMGAKRTAKEAAEGAAKNVTRRAEEGFNPSEALDALKPTRTVSVKGKDIPVKQGKPNFGGSTENMGVKEVMNKSGKKIPVKRSGMADDGGSGAFKRGGTISKADMKKAGFYDKGRTKSERQKIVNKVTTKPQRVAIVEKAFSSKNMKSGGMASRRADGCAIRGKTRA